MARIFKPKGEQPFFASARGRVNEQEIVDRRIKKMSHDENEQQHIKQTRQSIHLQSQPHKKGSPLVGGGNRDDTRIGVVGVSPTDIPRRGLGCQPNLSTDDNLLATHFIKLN